MYPVTKAQPTIKKFCYFKPKNISRKYNFNFVGRTHTQNANESAINFSGRLPG